MPLVYLPRMCQIRGKQLIRIGLWKGVQYGIAFAVVIWRHGYVI